jgi:thiol:disulfide interchange protein
MGKKALVLASLVIVVAVGAIGCSGVSGAPAATGTTMVWETDWTKALTEAQAENKPILVNFYTNACPSCRKMDQTTFVDADLVEFLEANFINLKSNAGESSLYQRYGISAVPTIVFSTPEGYDTTYEISRFVGYRDAAGLREEAEAALAAWQS